MALYPRFVRGLWGVYGDRAGLCLHNEGPARISMVTPQGSIKVMVADEYLRSCRSYIFALCLAHCVLKVRGSYLSYMWVNV